jgi:hypothetical protein
MSQLKVDGKSVGPAKKTTPFSGGVGGVAGGVAGGVGGVAGGVGGGSAPAVRGGFAARGGSTLASPSSRGGRGGSSVAAARGRVGAAAATRGGKAAAAPAAPAAPAAAPAPAPAAAPAPAPAAAPAPPLSPPNPHAGPGSVKLLYNHYKSDFSTLDGRLPAIAVDCEYCFHVAFRGAFKLHLVQPVPGGARAAEEVDGSIVAAAATAAAVARAAAPPPEEGAPEEPPPLPGAHAEPHHCGGVVFTGLPHGSVWKVLVEDDPLYAPTGPAPPLRLLAFGSGGGGGGACGAGGGAGAVPVVARPGGPNRIANELTQELKDLPVEELRAGSEKYKQLLEARELESALYGGGT